MTYMYSNETKTFEKMTPEQEAHFNQPYSPEEAAAIRAEAIAYLKTVAFKNNLRLDGPLGALFQAEALKRH